MIEEQARVSSVHRDQAEIVVERQTACGTCSAKSGCGTSLLATWLPRRRLVFRLRNEIGARPGDTVMVGLDEGQLQRGSLLLYALPLGGLILGAVGGEALFALIGMPTELGAVLLGLLGLAAALGFVAYISSARLAARDGGVRMLRVISSSRAFAVDDIAVSQVEKPDSFGTSK